MELGLIVAALRRHKLTVLLMIASTAFTCAIVCNCVFMISGEIQQLSVPTGLAENELSLMQVAGPGGEGSTAQYEADLRVLGQVAGVTSVAMVSSSLPLNGNVRTHGACATEAAFKRAMQEHSLGSACFKPSIYDGSAKLIDTLGLHLIMGRQFVPSDYVDAGATPKVAIISSALAQKFYPGESPLGKEMYVGNGPPIQVVGVVATLLAPTLHTPSDKNYTMIWPQRPQGQFVTYVMRSNPSQRWHVLQRARAALLQLNPNRIIGWSSMSTYSDVREKYFKNDTDMIGILLVTGLGMLVVTALGITGLANFWVLQRRRSIGIRRALGATRRNISSYFQIENFVILGAGTVCGAVMSVGLNMLLMKHYEVSRLPFFYIPISAILIWIMGQAAVIVPALRAAGIQPNAAIHHV